MLWRRRRQRKLGELRAAVGTGARPELCRVPAQRGVGSIEQVRELDPGGWIYRRAVPAGWYAEAWWRTALTTGAGLFGGMMLFDILASGFCDLVDYGAAGWGEDY